MLTICLVLLASKGYSISWPGPGYFPEVYRNGLQTAPDLNDNDMDESRWR